MSYRPAMVLVAIIVSITPAFAAEYFVEQNKTTMKCNVTQKKPSGDYTQLGKNHASQAAAEKAMKAEHTCK